MKGQTTLVAIVSLFAFVIGMAYVGIPLIQSVDTSGWSTWSSSLWVLVIPFLFISAIIFMIYHATPKYREARERR